MLVPVASSPTISIKHIDVVTSISFAAFFIFFVTVTPTLSLMYCLFCDCLWILNYVLVQKNKKLKLKILTTRKKKMKQQNQEFNTDSMKTLKLAECLGVCVPMRIHLTTDGPDTQNTKLQTETLRQKGKRARKRKERERHFCSRLFLFVSFFLSSFIR